MFVVSTLQDLRAWCLSAQEGQQEDFSVCEAVVQDVASQFAGQVNQERERDGHVWIDVQEVGEAPESTTKIHIRCTN